MQNLSVVPANESTLDDLQTVFGRRGQVRLGGQGVAGRTCSLRPTRSRNAVNAVE